MVEEIKTVRHINQWFWGCSVDIVKDDGTAMVCVKFDEKSFPKTGYICDLSVIVTERRKGLGQKMMKYALICCEDHGMTFARLHVDAKIHKIIVTYKFFLRNLSDFLINLCHKFRKI